MNQELLSSNLSLLVINVSLTGPDRVTLDTEHLISGTTFTYIAQVNSFSENDAGDYTCMVTISPQLMSAYLIGTGALSGKIRLKFGNI